MKALTVDFTLIAQSMRDLSREHNDYFLDKTSARVISLSRDLICALTKDRIEERDVLPEWDARMIPIARKIVLAGSKDFVRIPEAFGCPEHQWRVAFTDTIQSKELKQKLTLALRGRGSCKRFREILKGVPGECQRWSTYHADCWKERVSRWLESVGILAFEGKPARPKVA